MEINNTAASEEAYGFNRVQLDGWLDEWMKSPQFENLSEDVQDITPFAVGTFADYAYNYEGASPSEWTAEIVRYTCLGPMVRKISAPADEIALTADALAPFFEWLRANDLHPNAEAMRDEAQRVKPEMFKAAADPSNWGMAKTMMMGALDEGVDLSSQDALNEYVSQLQLRSLARLAAPPKAIGKPKPVLRTAAENPYKNMNRNALITVRYTDGTEKTGKFKRLEDDLRSGKCELV